jgi:predicted cupin superfamily sugar epimerase
MAESVAERIAYLKDKLGLMPHPEGGFFRETYRAEVLVPGASLVPMKPDQVRHAATMIYFLVTPGSFSALHTICSDEGWHFYEGTGLEILSIDPETKQAKTTLLGLDFENNQSPQTWIPAGHYFGSRAYSSDGYALVGCTVAPGFDFADFHLPTQQALLDLFPQHSELIVQFSR